MRQTREISGAPHAPRDHATRGAVAVAVALMDAMDAPPDPARGV